MTLAGILTLAGVGRGLASTRALTAVDAHAMDRSRRLGTRGHGDAGQSEHNGGNRDAAARNECHFHLSLPQGCAGN